MLAFSNACAQNHLMSLSRAKGKKSDSSASEQRTITTPNGAPVPTTRRASIAWRTLPSHCTYPALSMRTLCSPISPLLGKLGELGQGNVHLPVTQTHKVHTCSSHHISSLTPDKRTLQVNLFVTFGVYLDFFKKI